MSEQNQSGNYNHVRCQICGYAWLSGINERTGRMEPGHLDDAPCSIHRPTNIAPGWVADALARHELAANASNFQAPAISDVEKARREVAGGVPTREWPLRERSADSGPAVDPMAGWPASAADGVRVERSGYLGVISTAAVKNGAKHV